MGLPFEINAILRSDEPYVLERGRVHPFGKDVGRLHFDQSPIWLAKGDWTALAEIRVLTQSQTPERVEGTFRVLHVYEGDEQRALTAVFRRMYASGADPFIYLTMCPDDFAMATADGTWAPESLTTEGFIHASPADQLTRVANKHYGRFDEVRIVSLRADRVRPEILWEPASDNRLYPHIYGPLNMFAAERSFVATKGPDGRFSISNPAAGIVPGGGAPGTPPRRPVRDWRQGITLATMRPLTAVPGAMRMEAMGLEAAGDGVTASETLANRGGYDPDVLEGWDIPLPMPSGDMRALRRGGGGVELKYEHFSVIMSASRRMPLITACNINGAESRRLPRIDRWNYDGRLDEDDQWGNELYRNNDVDRGHMVRREDPVWGTLSVAKRANVDTFHYTNSCPQMAGVNQVIWLGLEDHILNHTREDKMRVSVFTGPIFSDQDFPYRGALIPKAFWKVVAFLTDDGRPSATAYKVSQARELQELEFVFAGYKTFQISVQQVMDATGIDFRALIPFDGFSQHERVHGVILTEQLERLDQIRV